MNPYDLYAIEEALALTERYGGSVQVITMGPPQAKAVVVEAISMGAASGTVLSDRKFAGADVLATAYTLSQGIKRTGEFDIIICGKQTTDGDTAQVGAEVAEYLGLPNVSNVLSVEEADKNEVTLKASLDNKTVSLKVQLPCVISVDSDINSPRLPSYKVKQTVTDDIVKFLSFDDLLDKNENNYGLKGSATQVERIFPPEKNSDKQTFLGTSEEKSQQLFELIKAKKLI